MRLQTAILLPFVLVWTNCSISPKAVVGIRQHNSLFDFRFHTRGVNGLLSLRLWQADTKKVFWDINLNYFKDASLRYGDLPDLATQNIPHGDQKPDPLPPSQKFYLTVDCQYDRLFAASSRIFYFSFATDKNGRISPVSRIEHITSDALPNPQ